MDAKLEELEGLRVHAITDGHRGERESDEDEQSEHLMNVSCSRCD